MPRKSVLDWDIGEVGHHPYYGRCIVKDIQEGVIGGWLNPVLLAIREYDGEIEWFGEANIRTLIPIDEWDASKELKELAAQHK